MSTMIVEVYDALKEAGASEEKAKAAASAIADFGSKFSRIESKLESLEIKFNARFDSVETKFDSEIKIVKAEIGVLKWMLGFAIAGVISIFIKLIL